MAPGLPTRNRPVPTARAVALVAAGLLPAALAGLSPTFGWTALALGVAVVLAVALDFLRAPRGHALHVERHVEPVLSAGVAAPVTLHLALAPGAGPVRGRVHDTVAPGVDVRGLPRAFTLTPAAPEAAVAYAVTPALRGDLPFGDVHLRLLGPWGLCARDLRLPRAQAVKVYPDLRALTRDALALAAGSAAPSARTLRRPGEGREFESLRDYREGDDVRALDWKSTARRGRPMVRTYQPERHQPVLLVLDCGRHMAGTVGEGAGARRKLDHAVDAALRLAQVGLEAGDHVGVLAFAREVRAFLPPRGGRAHLRELTRALYRVEATLEESDWGAALDLALARQTRRTLVVALTDLLDPEAATTLAARMRRLPPRHLPLVVSLLDADLQGLAHGVPGDTDAAFTRQAAAALEADARATALALRHAGARVVRALPRALSAASVDAYLDVKARGLL